MREVDQDLEKARADWHDADNDEARETALRAHIKLKTAIRRAAGEEALRRRARAGAEIATLRGEIASLEEEARRDGWLAQGASPRAGGRPTAAAVSAGPTPAATGPAHAAPRPAEAVARAPVTRMRQPDAYAIVIGVEKYRRDLPEASGAANDARAFHDYLERTLGVPRDHIKVLVDGDATKSDIEAAINEWLPSQPRAATGNTYFFFSGHGAPDPTTGDSYLVPYDGDPSYLRSKAVSLKDLYARLGKLPQSRALAFVDACFSGTGPRSVLPAGARPLVLAQATRPTGGALAALSAASAAQISGPKDGANHGLFTYHLLRGLSGLADRDGDHAVSLFELDVFVRRHVTEEARRSNREQVPELNASDGTKPGDWLVVDGLVD
jgi:hypothetical protein